MSMDRPRNRAELADQLDSLARQAADTRETVDKLSRLSEIMQHNIATAGGEKGKADMFRGDFLRCMRKAVEALGHAEAELSVAEMMCRDVQPFTLKLPFER